VPVPSSCDHLSKVVNFIEDFLIFLRFWQVAAVPIKRRKKAMKLCSASVAADGMSDSETKLQMKSKGSYKACQWSNTVELC